MNITLSITKTIYEFLAGYLSNDAANIGTMVTIALIYLAIFAVAGLYLVLLERKVAAWFQLRIGPNRVGFWGLLQTMADALKLVSKELTGTVKADKFLYNLAPYFVIVSSLMALAVFPFTKEFQAFDINIGVFFLIAISSIGVIGHIGLGRYGDEIDPNGHVKAIKNICNLTIESGLIYILVPVGKKGVEFNSHRVLDPKEIINYFKENNCELLEFNLVNDFGNLETNCDINNSENLNFGGGIFIFKKL